MKPEGYKGLVAGLAETLEFWAGFGRVYCDCVVAVPFTFVVFYMTF